MSASGLITGLGSRFGLLTGFSGAGATAWTLLPRQVRIYTDRADLYERDRVKTNGTPGNETWRLVASNIPYYHEGSVSVYNPTPTGLASDDDMITTDHGHFPAGVPFIGNPGHNKEQCIVNRSTGASRSDLNGTYVVLGPPWNKSWRANKQTVMLREADFDPLLSTGALAAGGVAAAPATSSTASVTISAATHGVGPYDYLLEYQEPGDLVWREWGAVSAGVTTVDGLLAGHTYVFRSTATDQLNATAEATSSPVTLPQDLAATLSVTGKTDISISVSAAVTGGIPPYSIQFQYKRSNSSTWLNWGTAGTATTATITGLLASTSYDARVIVTDAASDTVTDTITSTQTNAGWHPGQITGAVYYEPTAHVFTDSAGTTPATTGDPVGRINDWGAGANHSVQATSAARPQLVLVNGKAGIQFDGVDDFLATINNLPLGNAQTMFCAYKLNLTGGTRCIMGNAYSGTDGLVLLVNSSNLLATSARVVTVCTSTVTEDNTTLHYVVTQRSGAFTDVIRRGGVSVGGSPNSITIGTANQPMETGRLSGSASLQFAGVLFGWGAVPASISLSDRNLLEAYLAALIA